MLKSVLGKTSLMALACSLILTAHAADSVRAIDVPAGDLLAAIETVEKQTDVEIVYQPEALRGLKTSGVSGNLTTQDAVRKLLAGTQLRLSTDASTGAMLIVAGPERDSQEGAGVKPEADSRVDESGVRLAQSESNQTPAGNSQSTGNAENGRSSEDKSAKLEEIIVTAQRREQDVQDVPMAMEVLSGKFIEETGFVDFEDYARTIATIGFTPSGGRNSIRVSMRGVSPFSGPPVVGIYLDETLISSFDSTVVGSAGSIDPRLFDISRVEVLKGPQGHLYGASAMGGVIRIITNQPDLHDTEFRVDETLSTTRHGGLNVLSNFAANFPLVEGTAAARFVVTHGREEGYIDQVSPFAASFPIPQKNLAAEQDENVNSVDTLAIRGSLLVTPTDWLRITPAVIYQRKVYGGTQGVTPVGGSIDGNPQAVLYQDEETRSTLKIFSLSAVADIGFGEVTSNTAFGEFSGFAARDISNFIPCLKSPICAAPAATIEDTAYFPAHRFSVENEQFTQELRFVSDWDFPLGVTLGAYYRRATPWSGGHLIAPGAGSYWLSFGAVPPAFAAVGDEFAYSDTPGEQSEKAIFGSLNYKLNAWEFQVGVRHLKFEMGWHSNFFGYFSGSPDPNHTVVATPFKEEATSPSATVSYHVSDDHLIYVRAAQGLREGQVSSGQFPPQCGDTPDSNNVNSDNVWNYEVGAKTSWADGRLTLNAAAFEIVFEDVQQEIIIPACGYKRLENGGAATARGAELEFNAEPINGLVFAGSLGYVDSTLDDPAPTFGGDPGEHLLNVPAWTANASIAYTWPTSVPELDADFRIDWSYVDEKAIDFGGVGTGPTRYTDAYGLVALRAGVSHEKGWRVSLFVENAFDVRADLGPADFGVPLTFINQPRTIGVNFKKEF